MKRTVLGLMALLSGGAVAAPPPMEPSHNEPPPHMLKGMPMGPVGRFQMVRLIDGDRNHAAVMILDTANGHLWEWRETPGANGSAARAQIVYVGHIEPGTKAGEVIDSFRPSRP